MASLVFTAALDGIPVWIMPEQVIGVRATRPAGSEGDPGAQGTLIVTTGAVPDNRWVVTEAPNVVIQLIDQEKTRMLVASSGRASPPPTKPPLAAGDLVQRERRRKNNATIHRS